MEVLQVKCAVLVFLCLLTLLVLFVSFTPKLRYIEFQYFELPVLSNNSKWSGCNQCK